MVNGNDLQYLAIVISGNYTHCTRLSIHQFLRASIRNVAMLQPGRQGGSGRQQNPLFYGNDMKWSYNELAKYHTNIEDSKIAYTFFCYVIWPYMYDCLYTNHWYSGTYILYTLDTSYTIIYYKSQYKSFFFGLYTSLSSFYITKSYTKMMSLAIGLISTPCNDTMALQHFRSNTLHHIFIKFIWTGGSILQAASNAIVASGRSKRSHLCEAQDLQVGVQNEAHATSLLEKRPRRDSIRQRRCWGFTTENREYLPSTPNNMVVNSM